MFHDITATAYGLLADLSADAVAGLFILLIGAGLAMYFVFWFRGERQGLQRAAPGLLTLAGILGTFLGIAIGLVHFDVDNIGDSVPELLAGLRTAFITSIAGMVAALVIRLHHQALPYREAAHARQEVGPEDLHAEMRASREANEAMIGEIRELRTEMTAEFRSFAEQLSEMGSRQLIEALEQVIRDFNEKLTEQFGENFARLDSAVRKLADWQEGYAEQVERQTRELEAAVTAIRSCAEAIGSIEQDTARIPEHMARQGEVIEALGAGTGRLETLLKHYAEMADRAKSAVPEMDRHLKATLDGVEGAAKAATERHERMREQLQHALDDQRQGVEGLFNGLERQMKDSLKRQDEVVNERIEKIDEALQEELRRALQSLANHLGGVTQKFAEDYTELTENMRRVVAAGAR